MIRRACGRHTVRHLGAAALPAPDLVAAKRGGYKIVDGDFVIDGRDPDDEWFVTAIRQNPYVKWLPPIPDGPVGVFMNGRVHIAPATFDPPADSPFARMCRQLDDMQPTIRQLTQGETA
ncbi:hypothetical protein KNU54_gp79 [Gordonia phage VanDeWege]|uniref:Uncharacterized protein n=1 Tax=Gordonia phage VanDeWege TaxID=2588131 RepID=A0A4Y5U011_9CAUD|nr:hypothetical protein KNU54_gp79 [Gordonia phage VanDeWege]QDB74661.1 hypothetical protein SEA_VANDEWEGE_79 [Gordonia phage VanDeWege]